MHRRQFIGTSLAASIAIFSSGHALGAATDPSLPLPKRKRV